MPERPIDLLVIGGGPAGTTLAGLVKKHEPSRRVVLLEMCKGPRHHIGESLLPGLVPVLKELGVFEKIDGAGFPRKLGANYVWGKGREVWENDFNDVNLAEMLERHGGEIPEKLEYAWQVRRSEYDEILLRHAEELGVEVRRGWAAQGVLEEGGRIAGVSARPPEGASVELRAGLTADCSGQNGFLSRFRRVREYNDELKNVAGYSYWKGARWKYEYSGHPDKTKIFVCAIEHGWFWFIPIAKDVVSIGLVTSVEHLKKKGGDLRALYDAELAKCGEIAPLLEKAERMRDFEGTGKEFFTQNDWSYLNVASAGPGWLAAGDAAVFVDPILSSGVTLAHLAAHRAAYSVMTHWEADEPSREGLWADYQLFCRESAAQFLALALFWYGNDRSAESWWVRAREVQRAWLPAEIGDQTAFIAVSAGLTRHYERALSAADLAASEAARPADFPFAVAVMGGPTELQRAADAASRPSSRPRLSCRFVEEVVYLPAEGKARLRPVKRARFLRREPTDSVADALNPRRVVTRWHLEILNRLDGKSTLEEICAQAATCGVPGWWLARQPRELVRDLAVQGVVEIA